MLCNFSFHHIKISSRGLMIKHKQFDLNYLTKHIFSQNLFCEITVSGTVKPSFIVPIKHKLSVHFVNPYFSVDSGLIQTTTQSMAWITPLDTKTVREQSRTVNLGSINPNNSVLSFGIDQTAPHGLNQLKHQHSS